MKRSEHTFEVEEYDTAEELNAFDVWLVNEARAVTGFAYAPYSNFNVAAVARLLNGEVVRGTNQENASYPAGMCAERTLLSSVSSLHPGIGIETIAISYNNTQGKSNIPVSPCGLCRQSIIEYQQRFKKPIRIILSGMEGKIFIINNAAHLLPLAFTAENLNH